MSDIAIKVESLSKLYKIGVRRNLHDTFRDHLVEGFKSLFIRNGHPQPSTLNPQPSTLNPQPSDGHIWALQDVSFEVKHGEVLGIIGRNGAGKSTLLKILSRITEPTRGRAEIYGRIGSLLEVGTGFHPELTGRENIYLSGAVLGMKKAEIERKFDEIVAFAEIENFMDTPVKRYSSGMYVRLAFAVAAHLEPEILIVDEVLAVGDIEFQKKCLGRMGEVAKEGRTVLFVSHNMGAIDRLCERSLWVDRGRVVFDGASVDAIRMYQSQHSATSVEWRKLDRETDDREFSFLTIAAKDQGGQPNSVFRGNEPVRVEIEYVVHRWLQACQIGIRVQNSEGVVIFGTEDVDGSKSPDLTKDPGHYRAAFTIPANFLAPGRYSLFIGAHWPYRKWYEIIEQAIIFDISASGSLASDGRKGMVSPLIKWENSKISGS